MVHVLSGAGAGDVVVAAVAIAIAIVDSIYSASSNSNDDNTEGCVYPFAIWGSEKAKAYTTIFN